MSKISNVLLMLQYLENGKKYSIKELSEKLEVSERMIRSYKDELEKAGIYIDSIMGPYGGYVLNQSIRIPSRKISVDEYKFLRNLKVNKEDKERLDNIINKIQGLCIENNNELDEDIKKYYNLLNKAIKEHMKVKIKYHSYTDGINDRIIRPYDMFLYNTGWGCVAYCELRKDLRHFELKRIKSMKLLEEKF